MNDTPPSNDPSEEDPQDHDPAETTDPAAESSSDLPEEEMTESPAPAAPGGFKATPFIIVAVLVCVFAFIQVQRKISNRAAREEAKIRESAIANSAVALSVTWSNSKRLPLYEEKWYSGMTVRDLMLSAQDDEVLTFEETGEGDAAMLTSIGDTKNEGGGTESQNWIFRVNGEMADRSFGIYDLEKGDIVSWEFTTYE